MVKELKQSYSERFKDSDTSASYDTREYNPNAYQSLIWELEKKFLRKEIKKLVNKTWKKPYKGLRYLDFACGTGRVISFLEPYMAKSVGIDISKEMLLLANKKLVKSKLICQDISKKPIQGKYELVTAFRFFLNAEPELRDRTLANMRKIMNKDSLLILSIQGNKYSFRAFTYLIRKVLGKRQNQMSYLSVKRLLEFHGFKITTFTGVGFLPKFFYRFTCMKKIFFEIDSLLFDLNIFPMVSQTLIFEAKLK